MGAVATEHNCSVVPVAATVKGRGAGGAATQAVPYKHPTLPTNYSGSNPVVAG